MRVHYVCTEKIKLGSGARRHFELQEPENIPVAIAWSNRLFVWGRLSFI